MLITSTPYSLQNQGFSDKGHKLAQTEIYPVIFGVENQLRFTALPEEQARTLDGDMGTDRIVEVEVLGLNAPLTILVQERFRRPKYAPFQDVTITEWNHNSNLMGELYKIKAEMFLYAYYDEMKNRFLEAIAFSMLPLKVNIAKGMIASRPEINHRSNQSFFGFKFDDLDKHNISLFRKRWKERKNT